MESRENPTKFTPAQIRAIKFLGAGKVDTNGNKWTIEKFCKEVLKVHPSTFYEWQQMPGFKEAVFDESIGRISQFVPDMVRAQVHKAIKKQDTKAFMAVMRQSGLLKSDKIEGKNENYNEVVYKFAE